jgi:hypothetical protein
LPPHLPSNGADLCPTEVKYIIPLDLPFYYRGIVQTPGSSAPICGDGRNKRTAAAVPLMRVRLDSFFRWQYGRLATPTNFTT